MSLITSIEVNEKSVKKELPNFEYYDKIWSPKERELTNVGFYYGEIDQNYGEIDQVRTYLEPKDAFRGAISSASLKFRRVKEVNEDSTIKNTMITG